MPDSAEQKIAPIPLLINPQAPPKDAVEAEVLRQFFLAEEAKQKKDPSKQKVFLQNELYEFKHDENLYQIQFALPLVRREKYESIVTYESEKDLPEEKNRDVNTLYVVNRKDGSGSDIYSREKQPRFVSRASIEEEAFSFTPGKPIRDPKQISAVMRACGGPIDRYIYDTFDPTKSLGKGSFGSVHDVPGRLIYSIEHQCMEYLEYDRPMVVKHSKVEDDDDYDYRATLPKLESKKWMELDAAATENQDELSSETKKPTSKKDPNRDATKPVSDVYMVQGKFGEMTLGDLLIDRKLSFDERYQLTIELLEALQRFHRLFVHRDIKPENIMVYETKDAAGNIQFKVKIIDVGFAKKAGDKPTIAGSDGYIPPEILLKKAPFVTAQHDIYAMGMVLRRLWGEEVYAEKRRHLLVTERDQYAIAEYDFNFPMQVFLPPEITREHPAEYEKIKTLLFGMTMPRPQERLSSADEALSIFKTGVKAEAKEIKKEEILKPIAKETDEDISEHLRQMTRKSKDVLALALSRTGKLTNNALGLLTYSSDVIKMQVIQHLVLSLFEKFITEVDVTDPEFKHYLGLRKNKYKSIDDAFAFVSVGVGILQNNLKTIESENARAFIQYMSLLIFALEKNRIPMNNLSDIIRKISNDQPGKVNYFSTGLNDTLIPLLNLNYATLIKDIWNETYLANKSFAEREKINFAEYFFGYPSRSGLAAKLIYWLVPPVLYPLFSTAKNTIKLFEFGLKAASESFKDASYRLQQSTPTIWSATLSYACDFFGIITGISHLLLRTVTSPIASFKAANSIKNKWLRPLAMAASLTLSIAGIGALCYFAIPALIAAVPALTVAAPVLGYPAIWALGKLGVTMTAGFGLVIMGAIATVISEFRTGLVERLVNKNESSDVVHINNPELSKLQPESPQQENTSRRILAGLENAMGKRMHKQVKPVTDTVPTTTFQHVVKENPSRKEEKVASREEQPIKSTPGRSRSSRS